MTLPTWSLGAPKTPWMQMPLSASQKRVTFLPSDVEAFPQGDGLTPVQRRFSGTASGV